MVSHLALYSQFNLRSPYKESDDFEFQTSELAEGGVFFSRREVLNLLPNTKPSSDQILKLYESLVTEIKQEYNYLYADVARLSKEDVHGIVMRSQHISEHTHSEDEARFFIEGRVLVYINVNEKIHILQCGPGDLLIIPKCVKHWMDIGPEPNFAAIRWYNTRAGLFNEFTGSCVAESTPRWESIFNEHPIRR